MASLYARRTVPSLLTRHSLRSLPHRHFTKPSIRLSNEWSGSWDPPASTATSKTGTPTTTTATTTKSSNPSTTKPPAPRTVTSTFSPASSPPPPTTRTAALDSETKTAQATQSLTDGLSDEPSRVSGVSSIDWSSSYFGLGGAAFSSEQREILLAPVVADDVEVKPDGLLYLPEIKYRRILNRAFGPGAWGLVPRGETIVTAKLITREYGLIVEGRLVSIARGEQQYFDPDGIPTATEGCKSNALMRCCKDLGIASELWDPRFIRRFLNDMTKEIWVEHVVNKRKKKIVIRKDDAVKAPYKEAKF